MPNSALTLAPVTNGQALPRVMDGTRGAAGAVRIGLILMADEARRIDDSITELKVLVARVDAKLDVLGLAKDDHEKRIRAVEQLRTQVITIATLIACVASAVVSYALGHIQ